MSKKFNNGSEFARLNWCTNYCMKSPGSKYVFYKHWHCFIVNSLDISHNISCFFVEEMRYEGCLYREVSCSLPCLVGVFMGW